MLNAITTTRLIVSVTGQPSMQPSSQPTSQPSMQPSSEFSAVGVSTCCWKSWHMTASCLLMFSLTQSQGFRYLLHCDLAIFMNIIPIIYFLHSQPSPPCSPRASRLLSPVPTPPHIQLTSLSLIKWFGTKDDTDRKVCSMVLVWALFSA